MFFSCSGSCEPLWPCCHWPSWKPPRPCSPWPCCSCAKCGHAISSCPAPFVTTKDLNCLEIEEDSWHASLNKHINQDHPNKYIYKHRHIQWEWNEHTCVMLEKETVTSKSSSGLKSLGLTSQSSPNSFNLTWLCLKILILFSDSPPPKGKGRRKDTKP